MAATIGNIDVSILAAHGTSTPTEVATFSLPLRATFTRPDTGVPTLTVAPPTSQQLRRGIKRALRKAARAL